MQVNVSVRQKGSKSTTKKMAKYRNAKDKMDVIEERRVELLRFQGRR